MLRSKPYPTNSTVIPFDIAIKDIAEAIMKVFSGSVMLPRFRVSELASQCLFIHSVEVVR